MDRSMGTGVWGCKHGAWGWEHGDRTVRQLFSGCLLSKRNLMETGQGGYFFLVVFCQFFLIKGFKFLHFFLIVIFKKNSYERS